MQPATSVAALAIEQIVSHVSQQVPHIPKGDVELWVQLHAAPHVLQCCTGAGGVTERDGLGTVRF